MPQIRKSWHRRTKRSRISEFKNSPLQEQLAAITTFVIVAGVIAFVTSQMQPNLIFRPTMDVGGDTAGHIVVVFYFIHHILPTFRLTGWDPQWFDGFPLYTFYFPLPALVMAFFSWFAPYAVAFKMETALGIIAMPLAAYTMGRLIKAKRPIPALMSVGALLFVFNNWFTIDGGNITSTMAGEYSFTLGMVFMLLFIGVYVRCLETGRQRYLAVILFLLTALCHIVPAMFAGGAAFIITLVYPDKVTGKKPTERITSKFKFLWKTFTSWAFPAYKRPFIILITVGLASLLVSLFWLLPFGVYGIKDGLTTSLNNGRVLNSFWYNMFPPNAESAVLALALIGGIAAISRKDRFPTVLFILSLISAALFQWAPSALIYNGRWIPFWFLMTALLASYGVKELGLLCLSIFSSILSLERYLIAGQLLEKGRPQEAKRSLSAVSRRPATGKSWFMDLIFPLVVSLTTIALMASWLGVSPLGNFQTLNASDGWTTFNYKGFQGEPGWSELQKLIQMLDAAGHKYGCGRLDYEYGKNTSGWFGSTDYTMSLPYWTNGCMDSEGGLYYQSSTTTDFHFLDQAELAMDASKPVAGIAYENFNIADGIRHLQLNGVKYFLANSPQAEEQAAADPLLIKVGTTPASVYSVDTSSGTVPPIPGGYHWDLYLIKNTQLVTPLSYKPVVEAGISKTEFLNTSILWYQQEQYWQVPIARTGPANWTRATIGTLVAPTPADKVIPTKISNIHTTASTITFHVTKIGSPVLVKEPYFPNWQVTGATGPYEVSPNLMVVVPTSHTVYMAYGTTMVDWVGRIATIAGFGMIAIFIARGPVTPISTDSNTNGNSAINSDTDTDNDTKAKRRKVKSKSPTD